MAEPSLATVTTQWMATEQFVAEIHSDSGCTPCPQPAVDFFTRSHSSSIAFAISGTDRWSYSLRLKFKTGDHPLTPVTQKAKGLGKKAAKEEWDSSAAERNFWNPPTQGSSGAQGSTLALPSKFFPSTMALPPDYAQTPGITFLPHSSVDELASNRLVIRNVSITDRSFLSSLLPKVHGTPQPSRLHIRSWVLVLVPCAAADHDCALLRKVCKEVGALNKTSFVTRQVCHAHQHTPSSSQADHPPGSCIRNRALVQGRHPHRHRCSPVGPPCSLHP